MSIRQQIVANDTPQLEYYLLEGNDPINLSDSETSILFKVRRAGETALLATVPCLKLQGRVLEDDSIALGSPYNVAGYGGRILVPCPIGLFAEPGQYEAEIEVTFGALARVSTPYETISLSARADF